MRRFVMFLAAVGTLLTLLLPATPAFAAVDVLAPACKAGDQAACTNGADPITGSNGTIGKVSRLIAFIAGGAAIITITIGGIMYLISGGDAGKVSAAKNTILYAAIGLVVVVLAQSIILFVIGKVK